MIVAIQKGMGALSQQLRDLGYEVVIYGEYKYPIDALVYYESGQAMQVTNIATSGNTGVFMLNAANKTISQIDQMLKSRLYSPLF